MWLPKPGYSITRSITIPYFTPILWILGVVWVGIVTLLNIAAVGYDTVTLYSESFDSPQGQTLWYERFFLTKFVFPSSWNCTPSLINTVQRSTLMGFLSNCSFLYNHWHFPIYFKLIPRRKTRRPCHRIAIRQW
jgi:hypothetical protein